MRHPQWPALVLAVAIAAAGQANATPHARPKAAPAVPPPARSPDPRPLAPAAPGKIYVMEILQIAALSPELTQKLGPLHSLAEVEALLKQERIPFGWRIAEAPSNALAPELVRQIEALPPHEVFVLPQKGGVVMAVVLETKPAPP